ncbi:MAG TPA: hypothetical protein VIO64_11145 [Pseudobacteroides sp.]|uniref:hypothetical protein n=1 Tax=Pseudobacteroides sp. TaxID=1968840 RepID=UPI002F928046
MIANNEDKDIAFQKFIDLYDEFLNEYDKFVPKEKILKYLFEMVSEIGIKQGEVLHDGAFSFTLSHRA